MFVCEITMLHLQQTHNPTIAHTHTHTHTQHPRTQQNTNTAARKKTGRAALVYPMLSRARRVTVLEARRGQRSLCSSRRTSRTAHPPRLRAAMRHSSPVMVRRAHPVELKHERERARARERPRDRENERPRNREGQRQRHRERGRERERERERTTERGRERKPKGSQNRAKQRTGRGISRRCESAEQSRAGGFLPQPRVKCARVDTSQVALRAFVHVGERDREMTGERESSSSSATTSDYIEVSHSTHLQSRAPRGTGRR